MKDEKRVEASKAEDDEDIPLEVPISGDIADIVEAKLEKPEYQQLFDSDRLNDQLKLEMFSRLDKSSFTGKEKGLMMAFMLLKTSTKTDVADDAVEYLFNIKQNTIPNLSKNTLKKALVMLNDNQAPAETRIDALKYLLYINKLRSYSDFKAKDYDGISARIHEKYKKYSNKTESTADALIPETEASSMGKRPPPPAQQPLQPKPKWVAAKTRSNTAPSRAPTAKIETREQTTQSAIESVSRRNVHRIIGKEDLSKLVEELQTYNEPVAKEPEPGSDTELTDQSSPRPPTPGNSE